MNRYLYFIFFLASNLLQAQPPTRVGIWEKFDKYSLPADKVFVNNGEYKNQRDDDADGYIDNINGIGFDANEQLTPEYFYCSTATADQYDHGTAVASVLLRHNPDVEIHGVGFVPTSQRMRESGIGTMSVQERLEHLSQEYARMNAFVDQSLAYFDRMQCRVVNISWGLSLAGFVANNPNLGNTRQERQANARAWLRAFKSCLTAGFNRYPSIIFVVAVGNDGKNANRAFDVPGSIQAKNVIRVGALNSSGTKRANYSNYGKNIIYAEGTDIAVTKALKQPSTESGTSLAAPVVTALVARLWQQNEHLPATITPDWLKKKIASSKAGPDSH